MKVGKMAAIAVGGGIILLQIANQEGYVKIDWSKINSKVDKVTDKVEEAVTGEGPKWMDKVCWIYFVVACLYSLRLAKNEIERIKECFKDNSIFINRIEI